MLGERGPGGRGRGEPEQLGGQESTDSEGRLCFVAHLPTGGALGWREEPWGGAVGGRGGGGKAPGGLPVLVEERSKVAR